MARRPLRTRFAVTTSNSASTGQSSRLASLGLDTPLIATWHEVWRSYWDDYLGTLAPFGKLIEHVTGRVPQHPIAVAGITADRLHQQAEGLTHRDQIDFLGFLDDYEDVLGHMSAARVFASPSTREGFGITFAEAMAADCTVIAADHPESAASEVVEDAGFVVEPRHDKLVNALGRALSGERPAQNPTTRAKQYDWNNVAMQAENAYMRAADGKLEDGVSQDVTTPIPR